VESPRVHRSAVSLNPQQQNRERREDVSRPSVARADPILLWNRPMGKKRREPHAGSSQPARSREQPAVAAEPAKDGSPRVSDVSRVAAAPRPIVQALQTASRDPWWWVGFAIVAAYAIVVVVTASYHERWRDEVVPLSIAREMPSFVDLWRMVRHEGHPLLWYAILRYAYLLFGTNLVLPAMSLVIAIAAIVVFVAYARMPIWLRALFVFGYLPIFEYSVVARANGLAMLLLFAFCALWSSGTRRPIAIGLVLAALANTSAHAFIIAAAAGAMLAIDAAIAAFRGERPTRRALAGAAVYALGLAHALVSNTPDPSTLSLKLYHHDLPQVLAALGSALLSPVDHSARFLWVPLTAVWVWLAFVLLLRRPGLLAFLFLSLIGFEMVFSLLYPASPRHMGHVLLVVIATVWLWNAGRDRDAIAEVRAPLARAELWASRLLLLPLVVVLGWQVALGAGYVADDVRLDYSSSRRLAGLLAADPRLERAIVIGEPENLTHALAYYRDNRIYLPQEGAFRNWMHFWVPGGRRADYTLAELLATATELRDRWQVPVVMALGWSLNGPDGQVAYAGTFFEQRFRMSAADRTQFLARTEFLGSLREASFTDENYDVFVLR
jgi:hypothetical protein